MFGTGKEHGMTRDEIINFLKNADITDVYDKDEILVYISRLCIVALKETGHVRVELKCALYALYTSYPNMSISKLRLARDPKPPWTYCIFREAK